MEKLMRDEERDTEREQNGPFGGLSPAEAAKRRWELTNDDQDLLEELRNAAYGRGKWKELSADKRLAALIKCIEYEIGRPLPRNPDETEGEAGFTIGLS